MAAPVLIFAVGNESRGDDALAPLLLRGLAGALGEEVDALEDYQLQVEHVTDLAGRERVLFIDADMSCGAPFHFSRIAAAHDHSYTSHAMTPFALLYTYRQVFGADAPPSFLLRIRGYGFELGEGLSGQASANLKCSETKVREWLAADNLTETPSAVAYCEGKHGSLGAPYGVSAVVSSSAADIVSVKE